MALWPRKISKKRAMRVRAWRVEASAEKLECFSRELTHPLILAATVFKLKPSDPTQAAILLRILADLVFDRGERGRPKNTHKWAGARELKLGYRFHLLRQEKPGIGFAQAARIIKKRWEAEYVKTSEKTLRERMRAAHAFYEEYEEIAIREE